MTKRIPLEAFEFYVGLGPGRSYTATAAHYGVHRRSLVRVAKKHNWQARLRDIETEAQEQAKQRLTESYSAVTERHLKTLRAIQARALQALQKMPLSTGMQAVRALDLAIKGEQIIMRPAQEKQGRGTTLEDLVTRARELEEAGEVPESEDQGDDTGPDAPSNGQA